MENSFIYTLSSDDRVNTAANQIYYDIDFGGFNYSSDDYYLEVINCVVNGSVLLSNGYLTLIATDLNEDGVFCKGVLNANDAIMCHIPTNSDILMSSGGVKFKVKHCGMTKRIRLSLLKPNFAPVVSGTDINVGGIETKFVLTLKMTPIVK